MHSDRPVVEVFGLGGTIAMTTNPAVPGAVPALSAEELLAAVPWLAELDVTVRARTLRNVPGAEVGFAALAEVAGLIGGSDAEGFVVIQGTDTLEESAFFLDLVTATSAPVVLTGAMRHPGLAGADGPANLLAAVQVAAAPRSRDLGVLVVLGDQIHAARRVRKSHTTSPAAFVSPDTGPLGHLVEGEPRYLAHPGPRLQVGIGEGNPVVPVVTATQGDGFSLLRPERTDLDGLVVAAFGVGHVPADTVELLRSYANRIPVVLASRIGAGPVHHATYAYPGSEHDLQRRGLLNAGFLDAYKARILLRQLIATGAGRGIIADTFRYAAR